jgi:hypothetical protein
MQIGTVYGAVAVPAEHFYCRMTIRVACTDRDDRNRRVDSMDELRRRRCLRAVVRDDEDIRA